MGNPLMDFEDVIKVLFFVVIFGGWILKAVIKNLIKPAMKRQAGHQGGPPAKGLREFLSEIRREEAGGGGPPARQAAAPMESAEELVWEEVDEVEAPRPAVQPGERSAFDEKREQLKREAERRRAERKRQRLERARRRQGELEPKRAATGEQPPQEWTSVAERHLDSKLDERHVGSDLDDRHLVSRLADRHIGRRARSKLKSAGRRRRARSGELTRVLQGLTVKDLIVAEVILGKPRSKKRRVREV